MNFDKSMQDIIFSMINDKQYMFYGLFLAELNKSFDDKFPTACVGKHAQSSTMELIIGKHFWEKTLYNESRRKAILVHELEHITREHLSDMAQDIYTDKLIANIAMDVSINQCIIEELPRLDENGEKCGVYIEDFTDMNLKKDEGSFYYYGKFMQAKEEKKESKKRGEDSKTPGPDGKPSKGNGKGTSGNATLDTFLDQEEEGKGNNWHELWGDLTKGMGEKEMELLRKEVQEVTRRIADETTKLQGNIPTHISNALKENFGKTEPVISWRTLFNRFVGSSISTEIYATRKRPNFRFPDAPTNKYKSKVRIVCGIDSSGSVSDYDLTEFFGQINHMYKADVKVDICMWDAACEDSYEYKGERTYKRTKSGGTHASCFTEHVNKNAKKNNWTCAIGLTDGYVESQVVDTKIPMLWVITKTGSTEFKNRAKKVKIN